MARLLGWAAVLLDQHPDQRAELAADASLLPNAVEELLRYEAPSPVQGRWTTREVELHGTTIPQDSKVLLLTGSAGRDERKYPDADRFDIHRTFDNHVSFGYGIHFCIGAALARMEGRIGLEEALARFPNWQVDHDARGAPAHQHRPRLDQRPRDRLTELHGRPVPLAALSELLSETSPVSGGKRWLVTDGSSRCAP